MILNNFFKKKIDYSLSDKVLNTYDKIINDRGFFGEDKIIITDWHNILDKNFVKIFYPLYIKRQNDVNKILYIGTKNIEYFNDFMYYKKLLLEQINAYCGFNNINNIKILNL